jgi:hypothetical protein
MPLERERHCPRLGHQIPFAYCLTCGESGGPCWKTADCWWERFDIIGYLKANYPEETVAALMNARPKPKITSILEMIEQAKQRSQNDGGEVDH